MSNISKLFHIYRKIDLEKNYYSILIHYYFNKQINKKIHYLLNTTSMSFTATTATTTYTE